MRGHQNALFQHNKEITMNSLSVLVQLKLNMACTMTLTDIPRTVLRTAFPWPKTDQTLLYATKITSTTVEQVIYAYDWGLVYYKENEISSNSIPGSCNTKNNINRPFDKPIEKKIC